MKRGTRKLMSFLLLLCFGLLASRVSAHLMVAQSGTVYIVGDSAFTVLSLPVSAFDQFDTDGDGKMSLAEYSEHRLLLHSQVYNQVKLYVDDRPQSLQGIMLSPVSEYHHAAKSATQIIVMGRFILEKVTAQLQLFVGLYGHSASSQHLKITVSREGEKNTFELSESHSKRSLFNL